MLTIAKILLCPAMFTFHNATRTRKTIIRFVISCVVQCIVIHYEYLNLLKNAIDLSSSP